MQRKDLFGKKQELKLAEAEEAIKNYKIKVSDIKLLAKEVLGIEIMTENIKF